MTGVSELTVRALGAFGLTTDDVRRTGSDREGFAAQGAADLDERLGPGRAALVSGASGAGKSSLLRALAARLFQRGQPVIDAAEILADAVRRADRKGDRVIDLLCTKPGDVPAALRSLSAAGLADAFLPAMLPRELSEGQRARLAIALAIRAAREAELRGAGQPVTILIDELTGTLDEAAGGSICIALRRWVHGGTRARIVGASSRSSVENWLRPDVAVHMDDAGRAHIRGDSRPMPQAEEPRFKISHGTLADYTHLSSLHYRAGKPATHIRILAARPASSRSTDTLPIGILVISMPTLNASWREKAWPGEYAQHLGRRTTARRINRDIRCISRLIVDPRWRGRGVASALLRAYLADPLTRRTEALSAMGAACPVFQRAGMRRCDPEPSSRDTRLIQNIEAAGLRPWMIADPPRAIEAAARFPHLDRAFRIWARAYRATRPLADADLHQIVKAAARSVITRPIAYTAG